MRQGRGRERPTAEIAAFVAWAYPFSHVKLTRILSISIVLGEPGGDIACSTIQEQDRAPLLNINDRGPILLPGLRLATVA
jgi:hypothetical protein